MPRNVGCGLNIFVTATSSFSPRRPQEEEKNLSLATLKAEVSRDEKSTHAEDKPIVKLPVLTRPRRVSKEESNNLQVLLRGIKCLDFSLDGLMSELDTARKKSSPSTDSQDLEGLVDSHETTQDGESFVYDQNHGENMEADKCNLTDKGNVLPLSTSILEGQRLNIREKEGLITKRSKHLYCKPREKENKLSCQTGSTSEDSDNENYLIKSTETPRMSSNAASLKSDKQIARPVFHLPKADSYDITPRNTINSKVCSVFKVSRKSSFYKSGYKNSWIPRHDSYAIKNSVFRTNMQQPAVFLRQPSPVAGVKMTLKEQEDSLAAAIQVVEKTNVQTPPVDAEVTRHVKKFVIRLPPIC